MLSSLLLSETCRVKLYPSEGQIAILEELFSTYGNMVKECLSKAIAMKLPMCCPLPLAAKALNEPLR